MTTGCNRVSRWLRPVGGLIVVALALAACSGDQKPPARGRLAMVGDSITFCSIEDHIDAFREQGWDASLDVAPGRGLITKMDGDPRTGVEAIDNLRSVADNPEYWVVALGTNDALRWPADRFPALIDEYQDHIGAGLRVMWVNVHITMFPDLTAAWNKALADADARRDDLVVFDWSAYVAEHSVPMKGDGVHYADDACPIRAKAIAEAATTLLGR